MKNSQKGSITVVYLYLVIGGLTGLCTGILGNLIADWFITQVLNGTYPSNMLWIIGGLSLLGVALGAYLGMRQSNFGGNSSIDLSGQSEGKTRLLDQKPLVPLENLNRVEYFKDREAELVNLFTNLKEKGIAEVCGPGGMGKTALAAEALHVLTKGGAQAPEDFPDGVIVHSFYKQADVNLAFEHILRCYGVEAKPMPALAVQELLAGKQVLLVLDGAEQAENLELLLRVRGRCGVIITSRERGQGAAEWQDLPPLEMDEGVKLLKDWGEKWATDEAAGRKICALVGGLPMAIVLVGSYLKESEVTAVEYAGWLERSPMAALDQGERRMESVPVLLGRSVSEVSEEARQALGVVGLLAQAPFERGWVQEALGMGEEAALAAFGELARYSLVRRGGDGCYQVSHALVHTYARKRGKVAEGTAGRLCLGLERVVNEERGRGAEGYKRLNRARPHALAMVVQMAKAGRWEAGKGLAWSLDGYLDMQGYWSERVKLAECGIVGAKEGGDRKEEGSWLTSRGLAYAALGQVEKAIEYYEQALSIDREIGDRRGEGADLGNLGNAYADLGQVKKAIGYYEQALVIDQEVGDQQGEEADLGNLGNAYAVLGQVEHAVNYFEKAMVIAKEIGDRRGEGNQLSNLGNVYADIGHAKEAIGYYEQALVIDQQIGDRRGEVADLGNLGIVYKNIGQVVKAISYIEKALVIAKEISDRRGEGDQLANLGSAYEELGEMEKACKLWREALKIFEEIRSPMTERVKVWLEEGCVR